RQPAQQHLGLALGGEIGRLRAGLGTQRGNMHQAAHTRLGSSAKQRHHRLHVHRIEALLCLGLEDSDRVDQHVEAAQLPHQLRMWRQRVEVQRHPRHGPGCHPRTAPCMDYLMTRLPQSPRHRTADHSAPTRQQDPQAAHGWRALLLHALGSGSAASLASTALVSLRSRQRAGTLPAGTHAASQWVWGEPARRASGWSLRHTLLGFAIHHASSVMWAAGYEAWGRKRPSDPALLRGAGMAALAYVVDYHVVPRRLSPGFENRIGATGVAATYAA